MTKGLFVLVTLLVFLINICNSFLVRINTITIKQLLKINMERGFDGRIEEAFASAKSRNEAAFISFVTAGYPTAKGTLLFLASRNCYSHNIYCLTVFFGLLLLFYLTNLPKNNNIQKTTQIINVQNYKIKLP
jgi:hypothetical protein